jgi:transmembrane sensor
MSNLQPPLRELLRDPLDDSDLERMRQRIAGERRAEELPRGSRWPVLLVGGGVAAAATIALYFAFGTSEPTVAGPLRLSDGAPISTLAAANDREEQTYAFDEGSTVRLFPGARLEPQTNTGTDVIFAMPTGTADFHVVPEGPRRWRIQVDLVIVEVVGTSFRVAREELTVTVSVIEGRVRVFGMRVPGNLQELEAGASLTVPLTDPPVEQDPTPTPTAETAEAPPDDGTTEPAERVRAAPSHVEWRGLAEERRYDEAFEALGPIGVEQGALRAADVDELFALSDVARLSGHPSDAVAPLRRIIADFSTDRRAGVAAFTLGRVQLDSLGNPSTAARSFARGIELGLPPTLVDDALARQAEAQWRGGDRTGARQTAQQYLRRYPRGRHADRVRQWALGDEPNE